MALDNYSNLKAAIIRLMGRNDIAGSIDDAIASTEARMFANAAFRIKIRDFETRSTATASTTSRFLALPDDYLHMRRLKLSINNDEWKLQQRAPELIEVCDSSQTGLPAYFTVTSQIEFNIKPDQAYTVEMQYYAKPSGLSDSNTTNSVLNRFPDVYLHGIQAFLNKHYTKELDEAQYHEGLFMEAISGANAEDIDGRFGPSPIMRTRVTVA